MADTKLSALRFFADAPDLASVPFPSEIGEAEDGEDKPPRSRIQIAKVGTFTHPRSGKAVITRETFDRMIANFEAAIPNDRLPVDMDHAPEFRGDTRACGWIVGLNQAGGNLYADVEWTWSGAFSVREGEYRYVSMAWTSNLVSDDGTKRGPALVGLALTNRPFLESMAPVSLSATFSRADFELAEEVDTDPPAPSDSRPRVMEFTANIRQIFGLDAEATEDQIVAKATEIVTASAVSLEDRAKADGKVVFTAEQAAELETQSQGFTALKAEVDTLKTSAADQRFRAAFDKAVTDCFVAPAEEDAQRKIFDASEEAFFAALSTRTTKLVNTDAQGQRGSEQTGNKAEFALDGIDVDEQGLDLWTRAETLAREQKRDAAEVYIELAEAV